MQNSSSTHHSPKAENPHQSDISHPKANHLEQNCFSANPTPPIHPSMLQSSCFAFSHHENDRWYIIQINQKNEESFAPIENIQIQLKNEFIRDQADKRLRAYIDNLKENASINYLNER